MEKPFDLNDLQWQAVCHKGCHLLITAGPGTGKTHTITHRIARQISELSPNEKILAITFTNKAAQQMQDRLSALGVSASHVFIGTFHSFCLRLLRDFWEHTALPKDFKVALPDDIEGFDKQVLEGISLIKSTKLAFIPDDEYKSYQRYLRQQSWIDCDDILREALSLLENEEIAHQLRSQYRHLFVDEYQDCNVVQHALLKVLAQEGVDLTAIGDPNQSIYGFRGSNVDLFHQFKTDYSSAKIMILKDNYRNSARLLKASGQMMGGIDLLARMHTDGKLTIHEAATDRAEADYVAHQIEKLVGGLDMRTSANSTRSFSDVVILYRLNAQAYVIAQALEHLGIPYQVARKPQKPSIYSDEELLSQREEICPYHVEKVSLMSLHASKGLEFPIVFIVGCEEKLLPLDLMGMKADMEEERRLLYVGMTRAKEQLYLTCAKRRQLYGQLLTSLPSVYLKDINEDLKAYEVSRRKAVKVTVDDGQMKLF